MAQEKEQSIKLYEIVDAIAKVNDMLEGDDDIVEYLNSIEMQFNEKVENIVKLSRGFELTAAAVDLEMKRLADFKKSLLNKQKRLKNYVEYVMVSNDIPEIKTDIARIYFLKSSSVVVDNQDMLTDEFLRKTVTVVPDKVAITAALKEGKEVPGARMEEHKNLQIK